MSTDNLHAASSQWATRPADERFWTLRDMRVACEVARANSASKRVAFAGLRTIACGDEVKLQARTNDNHARFTHYAFGQFCRSVGAPAEYIRSLPAEVASGALNAGLAKMTVEGAGDRDLLFHKNGGLTLRAALSARYDRVWDAEICAALERLDGWRAPAARYVAGESRIATSDDILPGQINIAPGDAIGPAGLYASDHDMFAFLVAPDRVISDGAGGSLMRGVFVRNSEVGDASLSVTCFLMQAVCGNHIVWGAQGVHEIRVRHIGSGTMAKAFRGIELELRRYRDGSSSEEERGIVAARKFTLGNAKAAVIEALVKYVKSHSIPLSRPTLVAAYETAEEHTDWYGPPNTLWASVAGLTQNSQKTGFADDRAAIDRAAGKLLMMAAS